MKPQITYKKWWHRFLPHYRKRIKILNDLMDYHWEKECMDKKIENDVINMILNGRPWQ